MLCLIHSSGKLTLHAFHSLEKSIAKLSFILIQMWQHWDTWRSIYFSSLFTMYFENICKKKWFQRWQGSLVGRIVVWCVQSCWGVWDVSNLRCEMNSLIYYCFNSDLSSELSSNVAAWGIYCRHLTRIQILSSVMVTQIFPISLLGLCLLPCTLVLSINSNDTGMTHKNQSLVLTDSCSCISCWQGEHPVVFEALG